MASLTDTIRNDHYGALLHDPIGVAAQRMLRRQHDGAAAIRTAIATDRKAIGAAVAAIAQEAKLVTPLERSAVRPTDHGPGSFFVCVREVNPPPDKPRRYYSTFLDNDAYKGSRLSAILDQCELQTYSPAPVAAPAQPPATPDALPASTSAARSRRNDDWFSRI